MKKIVVVTLDPTTTVIPRQCKWLHHLTQNLITATRLLFCSLQQRLRRSDASEVYGPCSHGIMAQKLRKKKIISF